MADTPPLACTLDAAEGRTRERDIRRLGRDGLVSTDQEERRVALHFRPDPDTRHRIEAIAAAERTCCSFLAFEVTASSDATVLSIVAPEGGETIMHELVSMFEGGTTVGA